MANAWQWYIVIMVTEDYYTLWDGYYIVRARSIAEANRKAKKEQTAERGYKSDWSFVWITFGPFAEKPNAGPHK